MATLERLSEVFVELADTLVAEFDAVDFMSLLSDRCAELLGATEAGVTLADNHGTLRVMASSSEAMHVIELYQLQSDEGPCLDCYRTGRAVINQTLRDQQVRWPLFAPEALRVGFQTVHALPMRLRSETIGAINLFSSNHVRLADADVTVGQAFADIATIGIIQERAVREARLHATQLETLLNTRVAIEQAKGIVAQRRGVGVDVAFGLLIGYARSNNRHLSDIAQEIIDGGLAAEALGPLPPPNTRPSGS
jgi:hypothetical protein